MRAATRREFLSLGAGGLAAGLTAGGFANADPTRHRNAFALVGAGGQGQGLMCGMTHFARCAAICDVDAAHLRSAVERLAGHYRDKQLAAPAPSLGEDYRRVLDDPSVGVVVVATPDHWHAKIAIEALHAGKAVYCEKPLTLTIGEGQEIERAVAATGGVLAVGAQQRSMGLFQNAAALVRSGRLGSIEKIVCSLGTGPASAQLPVVPPPASLNWNRWLGPAPYVPYRQASTLPTSGYGADRPHGRAHRHFRWWYEYSGGKLTDWGAHHVDIALWAMDLAHADAGVFTIDPVSAEHPVEFAGGLPTCDDRTNTATRFLARVTFANGLVLDIRDDATEDLGFSNGVMFFGGDGRILVNRNKLVGAPVEELERDPLPESVYRELHPSANPMGQWHLANFFNAVEGKTTPITDVASHHRALTVCHAANIAMRLGRSLRFDPAEERFVDDDEANRFVTRSRREGFEIAT